jgi:hypothetical protein
MFDVGVLRFGHVEFDSSMPAFRRNILSLSSGLK